jgi:hypothetical protein
MRFIESFMAEAMLEICHLQEASCHGWIPGKLADVQAVFRAWDSGLLEDLGPRGSDEIPGAWIAEVVGIAKARAKVL